MAKTSQPLSKQKGELLGPDNCLRHRKVPNSPLQGKNYPRKNDGPQRMCVISTPKEELPERLSKPGLEKNSLLRGKNPNFRLGYQRLPRRGTMHETQEKPLSHGDETKGIYTRPGKSCQQENLTLNQNRSEASSKGQN